MEIAVTGAVFAAVVVTLRVAVDGVATSATTVVADGVVVAAATNCSCGCLLVNGVMFVCFGFGCCRVGDCS